MDFGDQLVGITSLAVMVFPVDVLNFTEKGPLKGPATMFQFAPHR